MKLIKPILSIIIFWTVSILPAFGQKTQLMKSIISIDYEYLRAGINNPIRIVAQQKDPVSIHQLTATFQAYDFEEAPVPIAIVGGNGFFLIRPDEIGAVEINITIGDTIETKLLYVGVVSVAAWLGGRYGSGGDIKIDIEDFKAQDFIMAPVICCGFDARCGVVEFQIIRINTLNQVERRINIGGRFEQATKDIIQHAESGDMYIFRQITCQCPGSKEPRILDNLIFEIK